MQRNQENNRSEKGLTNISLKKINKSKVYQYIYRKKKTSKQQIVQELQMGLSAVSQNLNLLEQEGLTMTKFLAFPLPHRVLHLWIIPPYYIEIS